MIDREEEYREFDSGPTSHEIAKELLELPDLPLVYRDGYEFKQVLGGTKACIWLQRNISLYDQDAMPIIMLWSPIRHKLSEPESEHQTQENVIGSIVIEDIEK